LCLYGLVISVSHFDAQYAIYALLALIYFGGVTGTLVGVVRETMQPAYALLWLRPGSAPSQSEGSD
jgi:hypothetical protein